MSSKTKHELVCVAQLIAKEGERPALLEVLKTLIKPSKSERGCISYSLHVNCENPNMFTFIDKFEDQAAFDYHCEADYVKKAFDELIPPLVDSMVISMHQEIVFEE